MAIIIRKKLKRRRKDESSIGRKSCLHGLCIQLTKLQTKHRIYASGLALANIVLHSTNH